MTAARAMKAVLGLCLWASISASHAVVFSQAEPAGGGGIDDPSDVTGLVWWIDSDDLTTLWEDNPPTDQAEGTDGESIATWEDKSSNGWDMIPQFGNNPAYETTDSQNGIGLVRFESGRVLRNTSATTTYTELSLLCAVRVQPTGFGILMEMGAGNDADGFQILHNPGDSGIYRTIHDSSDLDFSAGDESNNFVLYQFDFDFANQAGEVFVDGVSVATDTGGELDITPTGFKIGQNTDIDFGECAMYDNLIAGTDKTDLEDYFDAKWAITGL